MKGKDRNEAVVTCINCAPNSCVIQIVTETNYHLHLKSGGDDGNRTRLAG